MSMPEVPDLTPLISLTRDDTLNLLLISAGLQELSLAHLLNTQGEQSDFALGLLDTAPGPATLEEIWETSRQTRRMLRNATRSQMLLGMQVSDLVDTLTK